MEELHSSLVMFGEAGTHVTGFLDSRATGNNQIKKAVFTICQIVKLTNTNLFLFLHCNAASVQFSFIHWLFCRSAVASNVIPPT